MKFFEKGKYKVINKKSIRFTYEKIRKIMGFIETINVAFKFAKRMRKNVIFLKIKKKQTLCGK